MVIVYNRVFFVILQLQLQNATNEVDVKREEIECHNQDLAIKDEQIRKLSAIIEENETRMDKLQREAVLSKEQQALLKLSLCVNVIHLKKQLKTAEHEQWLSQFKLRSAQKVFTKCKSSNVRA